MNYLSPQHKTITCNSLYRCRQCSGKYHTLLHLEKAISKSPPVLNLSNNESSHTCTAATLSTSSDTQFVGTSISSRSVILGTASIFITNNFGELIPVHALLDTGSQISVITSACVSRLGLIVPLR